MQGRLVYGEGAPLHEPGEGQRRPARRARVIQDRPMLLAINQQQADVAGWLGRLTRWLPGKGQETTGNAVVGPAFLPQEWWVDGQLARADIGTATLRRCTSPWGRYSKPPR